MLLYTLDQDILFGVIVLLGNVNGRKAPPESILDVLPPPQVLI